MFVPKRHTVTDVFGRRAEFSPKVRVDGTTPRGLGLHGGSDRFPEVFGVKIHGVLRRISNCWSLSGKKTTKFP